MKKKNTVLIFTIALLLIAIAGGLGSGIYSNYFNDVFHVTSAQRGFIEVPRESPGVLCVILVGLLGGLGNVKMAILAQILCALGLSVLGFLNPTYTVMLVCIFIHSMGEHLFMPLNDALSMSLSEKGKEGTGLGKFRSVTQFGAMFAAVLVFFGFRNGFLSFFGNIHPFAIATVLFAISAVLLMFLIGQVEDRHETKKRFILRKEYTPYYLLTLMYGAQKRVRIVFAPWVIITLLHQGADTVALLSIILKFISIWMAPVIGKYLDKLGPKTMLKVEAAYMIFSFTSLGFLSGKIVAGTLTLNTFSSILIYGSYILCMMFDQFNIVHSYAMRSIAKDPADVTNTLSMGLSIDHVMAIIASPLLGIVWESMGAQYVFYFAAASALVQIAVSGSFRKIIK